MGSYFGDKMKQYRKERKWSLDQLADKVGSSKQVLSRYERGERIPRISAAKSIADALQVELSEMVDITELDNPVDALSPNVQKLADFVKTVPEDKAEQMLRIMKAILASEKE